MKTILIVDDMPVIREPIALAMRLQGFRTVCACSGREALELVKHERPDLMVLDVAMPDMDGLQLLRLIRGDASLPQPPVILLTSMDARDHVAKASELGVRHYLLKTNFSLENLIAKVNDVVNERTHQPAA